MHVLYIDHNYDRVCANILFASAEVISANWCTVRVRRHPKHRPKAARPEFWVRCVGVDFTSLDLITAHTEGFVGNFDTKQYGTYSPTIDAVV